MSHYQVKLAVAAALDEISRMKTQLESRGEQFDGCWARLDKIQIMLEGQQLG